MLQGSKVKIFSLCTFGGFISLSCLQARRDGNFERNILSGPCDHSSSQEGTQRAARRPAGERAGQPQCGLRRARLRAREHRGRSAGVAGRPVATPKAQRLGDARTLLQKTVSGHQQKLKTSVLLWPAARSSESFWRCCIEVATLTILFCDSCPGLEENLRVRRRSACLEGVRSKQDHRPWVLGAHRLCRDIGARWLFSNGLFSKRAGYTHTQPPPPRARHHSVRDITVGPYPSVPFGRLSGICTPTTG
jgi:hypothetical protein